MFLFLMSTADTAVQRSFRSIVRRSRRLYTNFQIGLWLYVNNFNLHRLKSITTIFKKISIEYHSYYHLINAHGAAQQKQATCCEERRQGLLAAVLRGNPALAPQRQSSHRSLATPRSWPPPAGKGSYWKDNLRRVLKRLISLGICVNKEDPAFWLLFD